MIEPLSQQYETTAEPLSETTQQKVRKLLRLFKNSDGVSYGELFTYTQIFIVFVIAWRAFPRIILILPTQYGKLIADYVPVFTKEGWKNHGDLVKGDFVLGLNGEWIKVINVLPKQMADMRVTLTNGEVIDVNGSHEWSVYNKSVGRDMVMETRDMLKYQEYKRPQLLLPRMESSHHRATMPIDPYFLGYWLGDGISTKPAIVVHPKDRLAIDSIEYKPSSVNIHKTTGVLLYNFYKTNVYPTMKILGLIGNKHIPQSYKSADLDTKLGLLAGVIDSDGHVWNAKVGGRFDRRITIANINKLLIDDISDVLHSIDIRTSLTKVVEVTSSSGIVGKYPVYYLSFVSQYKIPTRIPRKKIQLTRIKRRIGIKSVEYIKPTQGNCITVDSQDGLYRVGKTMQPTHNSLSVSIGVLLRVALFKEKWAIVAPNEEKARIIMDYIIEHVFDSPWISKKLEYDGTKEKLKQERSKTRLTFRDAGEVRVYTADARNAQNVKKAMMGFGAPNVVLDESPLIPDDLYATIKRMVGGTKDNFLLEIGNPWYRNHFWRMWNNNKYVRIFIDCYKALIEGRYTQEYLDEMKAEAFYDVLYECHFPSEEEMLPGGYRQLLSFSTIENSFINNDIPLGHRPDGTVIDRPVLGVDPNHGGANNTVITIRYPFTGFAKVLLKKRYNESGDITAAIGEDVIRLAREYAIDDYNIGVDIGGVGAGVGDYLVRKGIAITPVLFGQAAENSERYANMKAELFMRLRKWIAAENGKLVRNDGFMELKDINYKESATSKTQMESKEDLSKRGIQSPDTADSLALTFITCGNTSMDDEDEPDIV